MIREIFSQYVNKTARIFSDRVQSVGASDVGQCLRKVFWNKNQGDPLFGAQRDADYTDDWGAAIRGAVFEESFFVPALRAAYGRDLLYAGNEQRTLVSGFLSATPDGLLVNRSRDALKDLGVEDIGEDGSIVIECKTVDPRARLDRPKPEHIYQAQVQLGLIHELMPHWPQYALIVYTDASFWSETLEFALTFDPEIFSNAMKRAALIMTATSASELLPEGWVTGGHECKFCSYTAACGRLRHAVPFRQDAPEPDPQFVAEITNLAREAKQHETDVDASTLKLRALQHEIRERLRSNGLRRVVGNGVSVIWSPIKGRTTLDTKRIREDAATLGLNLAEYETTSEPTDRLVISTHAATSAAISTGERRND